VASNSSDRGGLLTAGGVLSIVAGALQVIGGVIIALMMMVITIPVRWALIPWHQGDWWRPIMPVMPFGLIIIGVPFIIALGIVAIVGGVSALRRKSFGLSLAGAICALPSGILGILAIIFVSLSKREFEAKKSEAME
jgi:hypothetical protein